MGKLNAVAVVVGVFLVALMIGRYWNLKPETKLNHVVQPGETAVAEGRGMAEVWVAAEAGMTYNLHAAAARGEQSTLKRAGTEGKAFALEAGAQVRVAGATGSKRRIEVLTGPNTGKSGWVEFECLRPLGRGELGEPVRLP
ncbi:MAG: hypothetical protein C0504_15645 [Candidatus Solibacter sp.]|nr:hypothetical protein [Candidatus Solibacter sp.]